MYACYFLVVQYLRIYALNLRYIPAIPAFINASIMVQEEGLEPSRARYCPQDFKSCVSADSTTPAYFIMEVGVGFEPTNSGFAVRGVSQLRHPT